MSQSVHTIGLPVYVPSSKNITSIRRDVYRNGVYSWTDHTGRVIRHKSKAKQGHPMHGQFYYKVELNEHFAPSPVFKSLADVKAWVHAVLVLS